MIDKNWPIKSLDSFDDPKNILDEIEVAIQDKLKPVLKRNAGWQGVLLYDANKSDWNSFYNKIELDELPIAKQFINQKFDFKKILRIYLYNLVPGSALHAHRDMEGNLLMGNIRTHFCLKTNDKSHLIVDGNKFHLQAGKFASFSTSQLHNAENFGDEDRFHLVIDIENSKKNAVYFPEKSLKVMLDLFYNTCVIGALIIRDLIINPISVYKRIRVNLTIRFKKK